MKIDTAVIRLVYTHARQVYEGMITLAAARAELSRAGVMSPSSAKDYIDAYVRMRAGRTYKRELKNEATEYYLQRILADDGAEAFDIAEKSVRAHSEYLSSIGKGRPGVLAALGRVLPQRRTVRDRGDHFEELPSARTYAEGATKTVIVNARERSPAARHDCLAAHGLDCGVCGLNFGNTFGPDFADLIHVHHLRPATLGERVTDAAIDLLPVCPNCHAMLHFGRPHDDPQTVEELRGLLASRDDGPRR